MTQHTATCRISSADEMVARIDESDIEIAARQDDAYQMTVFLRPSVARTWARGILALADEIDGGEATNEAPTLKRIPQIGDRVRVVRNSPEDGVTNVGREGTLADIDDGDSVMPYRVRFVEDAYGWWCAEVEYVDVEPADEPIPNLPAIGSRYRVTKGGLAFASVNVGDVVEVTSRRDRYFGADLDGERWYFRPEHIGNGLEPVEEPLADWERDLIESAKAASPFTAHVDEAKRLLAGTDHTGADILALAVELADRS